MTLENAVYMNMKNDVAFLVDFQPNLYEHQSTWNPNMPLRNLFYVAKEYQTLTREECGTSGHLPDIKRVYALCGTGAAPYKDYGGQDGGTPGRHRMHPGGDPLGFPFQEQSEGNRSEYI